MLLVLPELFLTGYELPAIRSDLDRFTVTLGDGRLDPLASACAEGGVAVVVGAPTPHPDSAGFHISVLVLGRDGRFAAQYDKQHATPRERALGVLPGSTGCTLDLGGWRLGLGICADSGFPEHARAAALDGCHAYLVSALFDQGDGVHRRNTRLPARASDNTSYVVLADHVGRTGPYVATGHSAAWNPDGTLLVDAGTADPGLAVARLDPLPLTRARAEHPILVDPFLAAPVHPRTNVVLDSA